MHRRRRPVLEALGARLLPSDLIPPAQVGDPPSDPVPPGGTDPAPPPGDGSPPPIPPGTPSGPFLPGDGG